MGGSGLPLFSGAFAPPGKKLDSIVSLSSCVPIIDHNIDHRSKSLSDAVID